MRSIIADASPLILMAKLNLLDILCGRFNVTVPSAVASESTCRDDLADARYIQKLIEDNQIRVKKADLRQSGLLQKQWGLGKGEAEVLALAFSDRSVIVTDDFAAMRVAKTMRLEFTTTPMLIVEFERQKLLSLIIARSKLMELEKHAWLDLQILNRAIQMLQKGGR